MKIHVGGRYNHEGKNYLLTGSAKGTVEPHVIEMVSMNTGWNYTGVAVHVKDIHNITDVEWLRVCGGHSFEEGWLMDSPKSINSENYVEHVLRTESRDWTAVKERIAEIQNVRLLHAALGMVTEAAEVADALKKSIYYGRELDRINVVEELGDLMWYVGIACDVTNVTLDEVMRLNIAKLNKRYPDKFTEFHALNRDIHMEMKEFEDVK